MNVDFIQPFKSFKAIIHELTKSGC